MCRESACRAELVIAPRASPPDAPSLRELAELNRERNTSVHGGILESPFGTEDLEEAVDIGRAFARSVREYLSRAAQA